MEPRELKERLGSRAKTIIASGLNQKLNRDDEMLCPFHGDSDPSLSWFEDGYTFICWSCKEKLDIYRYYTDFENMSFPEAKSKIAEILGIELAYKVERKEYTKPTIDFDAPSKRMIQYFKSRGITENIVKHWDVSSDTSKFSEKIVFKHKDQKGKLIMNTFRDVESKKFERETGNKEILFGMEHINFDFPVIITEGHIDAMSVSMVYKNVVSIPSGIGSLAWIENCWNFIQKVERFIFWADNDGKNGIKGAENIRLRLGKEKCEVEYHGEYKDANALLIAEGTDGLSDFVDDITATKVNGIVNMGRRRSDQRTIDKFRSGFHDIDRHLKGVEYGCLSIIFGRDNEGKSTFISQMIAELLKNESVFLYSGELTENKIENWIMSQIIAGDSNHIHKFIDEWGDEEQEIKSNARQAICKWYRDRFFVYESKLEANVSSGLLAVMESAFKMHGVKTFFIDNMMCAVDETTDETTRAENSFVKKLKSFALTYNVHVFLVAHPNKQGSIEHQALNKVDVNGSKGITNLADYVFAVERSWNPSDESLNAMYRMRVEGSDDKFYTGIIRILKNRAKKPRKDLFYRFHVESLRFYNDSVPKVFTGDWKQHLKPEPQKVVYYNGDEQTFKNGELTEGWSV